MRRHGRALGLLLTSAAVVAAGLVATPSGTSSAVGAAPQVVYIDADRHLMVGALDGSDTPRALAPGLHASRVYLSPSGSSVVGGFSTGGTGYGDGTYAVVLRSASSASSVILSTHGAWTVIPDDGGGGVFLDSSGGIYDFSAGGVVTRRAAEGISDGSQDDYGVGAVRPSPSGRYVAYRWSDYGCVHGVTVLTLSTGSHQTYRIADDDCDLQTALLGWSDANTVLFSVRANFLVPEDDAVVYTLPVLPTMASSATDTGMRGITRVEHWGSEWWWWRAAGAEYGVSSGPSIPPTVWTPVPGGMTIVRTVTADPPAITSVRNRAPSDAHVSIQPSTTVRVGSSPELMGFARYAVSPPGWSPDIDAGPYAYSTATGVLYGSIDGGATWKVLASTSSYDRLTVSPLTRNLWLRWRHPGDAFTTSSTSIVRKVTATPLITVGARWQPPSGPRQVSGTVTRVNGTVKLLRWTGSTWAYVATTSISSTGRFNFGWRSLRAGKYRVSVPATTYWGSASKTFWA